MMIIQNAEHSDWDHTEIISFPVPLIRGDTILADGHAVAVVHETHMIESREALLAYIEAHPCR
jgi:hypothetical protein